MLNNPLTDQSVGEEIANSISHGVGLLAGIAVLPILIVNAVRTGDAWSIVGASIFGTATILMYFSSTIYHAVTGNKVKRIFQVLDHSAIFILIAGTYTPFTLGILRGPMGWTLFGLVWGMAIIGIVLKSLGRAKNPYISTGIYLAMGWLLVIGAKSLWLAMPYWGLIWLIGGGVLYSLGVIFYAMNRVRYSHFVWHLFVIGGNTCHIIAVLLFAG